MRGGGIQKCVEGGEHVGSYWDLGSQEKRGMCQPCHSGGLDSEEQGHWAMAGGRGNLRDSVSTAMGIGALTALGVGKSRRHLSMNR